ncbi:hypothetical protein ACBJ59_22790 [Nonomuraea sp. MTCD27]|uniref:hypothetical protein n=1 Tax=Nonomuraea sp. MTCD27 TaxID=1676747 RepID=UPI0035BEFAFD
MGVDAEGGEGLQIAGEPPAPGLESVTRHEDLVRLLAEEFARADVSLRELEARADKAGGTRLPRATCADMLAGRRFPKKAVMVAFLRACRVPEQRLPAWEQAWERVRIARLPALAGQATAPGQPAAAGQPTTTGAPTVAAQPAVLPHDTAPAPNPGPGRRRMLVVAMLASLAAASLGVLAGFWLPGRGPSEPPRGRTVTDDGRAFGQGGSSRFTVTVDPANTGVRLIRRLDAGIGMQRATITVNGVPAGAWQPLHVERVYRWKDQSADIPPSLTSDRRSLTVVNTFVSSYQDFNEFLYVVKQKVNGVWSTADTVDVGPEHAASESAHGYRITGPQTFAGVQEFAYPPPALSGLTAAARAGNVPLP